MAKKKAEKLHPRVCISVTSYRKRKHDPDGISIKYILDGLVQRGILPDDSTDQIGEIRLKSIIGKEEKTVIEITDENL